MRPLRQTMIAGAAALALAGLGGLAAAGANRTHVLSIELPDGSVQQIRYWGDTAPIVSITPALRPLPVLPTFEPFLPLGMLDRVAADLIEPDLMRIDIGRLPAGVQGYSMVSTVTSNGVCTRSVEYRANGDGKAPQVARRTSGNCGDEPNDAPAPRRL
jgi:hypothetical protein